MLGRIVALVSLSAISSGCLALPSTPTGNCLSGRTVDTSGGAIGQSAITVRAIGGNVFIYSTEQLKRRIPGLPTFGGSVSDHSAQGGVRRQRSS